ncbi:MAG: ATP-binding protein [Clostridia bacterium]|nr:ATP-binding protein [Clostridia bacterium]
MKSLKNRDLYLNKLIAFRDTEPVKVITGIRRCGKSSLLRLMIDYLKRDGVSEEQIISINFESMEYRDMDSRRLYEYVKNQIVKGKTVYMFFDEVQRVPDWQDAINSFRVDFDCDIYITGSNAYLLSSEFSTYLAGRYIEIKMLPLSFKEFIDFNDYVLKDHKNPSGELKKRIYDSDGESYQSDEVFDAYMKFGGMPGIADVGLEQDKVLTLLDGIYSTIVVRDILEREKRRGQRQITDADLLRKIIMFLADNIGNNTSVTSIGNTLVNEGLLDGGRKTKPAVATVQAYVGALLESYVFYEIKRFDVKGKEYLRTLGKYYIVDTGLRNYLLGYRDIDRGHVLENIVYFELLRRGYDTAIGKVANKEVDFVASKADEKLYIQVTETMMAPETRERELDPLKAIRDNYEKIVLTMDRSFNNSFDGIKIINVVDWLLR